MERSGVAYATPLFSQKEGTHIKKPDDRRVAEKEFL